MIPKKGYPIEEGDEMRCGPINIRYFFGTIETLTFAKYHAISY